MRDSHLIKRLNQGELRMPWTVSSDGRAYPTTLLGEDVRDSLMLEPMLFFPTAWEHWVPDMKESVAEKSTGKGINATSGHSSARPTGLEFPRAQHTRERFLRWVPLWSPYPVSSGSGLHLEKEPSSTLLMLW